MTSKLDICNRALLSVGARVQISSVDPSDGSVEGNACSVLFTPTFEALARSAQWNCLNRQASLSLLAAAQGTPENPDGTTYPLPAVPWNYTYAYPADCINLQYIIPTSSSTSIDSIPQTTLSNASGVILPTGGQIPYTVSTDVDRFGNTVTVVQTNLSQAIGVYTANISNPALWDTLFQAAMVASLGAYLVPALSLSIPLMQIQIGIAEKLIGNAKAQDGNEGVTVMDHVPDFILARSGGAAYRYGWYSNSLSPMIWPTV